MNHLAKTFSLSACALAASLLISGCGGADTADTVAPTVTISDSVVRCDGHRPGNLHVHLQRGRGHQLRGRRHHGHGWHRRYADQGERHSVHLVVTPTG